MEDTSQPGYWQGVHDDLVALGADLFVLDNVLGALGDGEDVASSVTARNTIDKLKPVSKSGIPVLAVTHTPKGNSEGLTTASAPIGGRAMVLRGVDSKGFAWRPWNTRSWDVPDSRSVASCSAR
ncbi:hypothetical protein [Streptomyces peucetius]